MGTLLNVENPPDAAWWGEGDEKIYVDGETFPSLFGTGTEDYFGYAWSTPERFEHAYHAQTATAGNGFGGLYSMNRFHVLDPIPFSRALRFDLEIWHWSDTSIARRRDGLLVRAPGRPRRPSSLFVDGIGLAARRQVGAHADARERQHRARERERADPVAEQRPAERQRGHGRQLRDDAADRRAHVAERVGHQQLADHGVSPDAAQRHPLAGPGRDPARVAGTARSPRPRRRTRRRSPTSRLSCGPREWSRPRRRRASPTGRRPAATGRSRATRPAPFPR